MPEGRRIFWWLFGINQGCGLAAALFARHAGIAGAAGVIVADLVLFRRGVRHHLLVAGGRVRRAAADHAGDRDRLKPCGAEVGGGWIGVDLGLCRDLRGQQNCAHQTQSGDHSCCQTHRIPRSFQFPLICPDLSAKSSFFAFWGWRLAGLAGRALRRRRVAGYPWVT